jgi:hypothetical protein
VLVKESDIDLINESIWCNHAENEKIVYCMGKKHRGISPVAFLAQLFAAHVAGRCPLIMNSDITYSAKVIRTAQLLFQHRIPVATYEFLMNLCKKIFPPLLDVVCERVRVVAAANLSQFARGAANKQESGAVRGPNLICKKSVSNY